MHARATDFARLALVFGAAAAPFLLLLYVSCASGQTYGQSTDVFDAPIEWENHQPTGPVLGRDHTLPLSSIAFADPDQKIVGRVAWSDGTLRFEGNVDASARSFFEHWYKVYAGPCRGER